jgi:ATP-dependent RNA helicase RhlE
MSFDHLGLAPELLRAVADQGYTEPTPVQEQAIPLVLAGRDLLAAAQTGTGKTAAFVLPILELFHGTGPRLAPGQRPPIRALVLTPTRELALQVEESIRTYGAHRPIRSTTIYGGVGFDPQVRALRAGPGIVVATPGRLLDHVEHRTIDLGSVEILVLDEADRMLDMGFIRPIRRILALLPARRQNLMFSATFSDDVRGLANGILNNPASVEVAARNVPAELVSQLVIPVDRERKRELLSHLLTSGRIDQALVFTRTKHGANRLTEQLGRDGIVAAAIHGNKSQPQRVRALADLKAGRIAVLVATDIAARGIDIDALPHVVNYELPMVASDYVHRIGRTGRAGVDGEAISLVCVDEAPLLREIEGLLKHRIPSETMAGFEPDRSIRPEAIRLRSTAIERREYARPASPAHRPRPINGARPSHAPRPSHGPRPVHASGPRPVHASGRPSNGSRSFDTGRPMSPADRPGGDPVDRAAAERRPWERPGRAAYGAAAVGFGNQPAAAPTGRRGGARPHSGPGRPSFRPNRPYAGPQPSSGLGPVDQGNHGPRPFALPGERIARNEQPGDVPPQRADASAPRDNRGNNR